MKACKQLIIIIIMSSSNALLYISLLLHCFDNILPEISMLCKPVVRILLKFKWMYAARHASLDRKIAFQEFIRIMFYQIIILQEQKTII